MQDFVHQQYVLLENLDELETNKFKGKEMPAKLDRFFIWKQHIDTFALLQKSDISYKNSIILMEFNTR